MNDCQLRERQCDCGRWYTTRQNGGVHACPECTRERELERQRNKYAKRAAFHKRAGLNVILLKSPLPAERGGYPNGAMFTDEDLERGLPMGAFVTGTELLVRGVRKIVGRIKGHYKLIEAEV